MAIAVLITAARRAAARVVPVKRANGLMRERFIFKDVLVLFVSRDSSAAVLITPQQGESLTYWLAARYCCHWSSLAPRHQGLPPESVPADAEGGEADFGAGRVGEAERAFAELLARGAFCAPGELFGERLGVSVETVRARGAGLGQGDEAETAVTARSDLPHEFDRHAAHGVAGIQFDDGLEAAPALWGTIDKRVDPRRAGVVHPTQFGLQQCLEPGEELVKPLREVGRSVEEAGNGPGNPAVKIGGGIVAEVHVLCGR